MFYFRMGTRILPLPSKLERRTIIPRWQINRNISMSLPAALCLLLIRPIRKAPAESLEGNHIMFWCRTDIKSPLPEPPPDPSPPFVRDFLWSWHTSKPSDWQRCRVRDPIQPPAGIMQTSLLSPTSEPRTLYFKYLTSAWHPATLAWRKCWGK